MEGSVPSQVLEQEITRSQIITEQGETAWYRNEPSEVGAWKLEKCPEKVFLGRSQGGGLPGPLKGEASEPPEGRPFRVHCTGFFE